MENDRIGAVLFEYRGLKGTAYPIKTFNGSEWSYGESIDEDGKVTFENVFALMNYMDALADELQRRAPEERAVYREAKRQGFEDAPEMGANRPQRRVNNRTQDDDETCPECGGATEWSGWIDTKNGKNKTLRCADGCKDERNPKYPLTIRWLNANRSR